MRLNILGWGLDFSSAGFTLFLTRASIKTLLESHNVDPKLINLLPLIGVLVANRGPAVSALRGAGVYLSGVYIIFAGSRQKRSDDTSSNLGCNRLRFRG